MIRYAVLGLLALALAGDAAWGAIPGAPAELRQGSTFLSTSVAEHGRPVPLLRDTQLSLTFRGGEIQARASCNIMSGSARVEDGRLVVGAMSATMIGCPRQQHAQDAWLMRFLGGHPAWRLGADDLVLTGDDTEIRLMNEHVANPDRPLQGTRWKLDSLVDGQVASSVPTGVTAWLVFGADGVVTGNAGCNHVGGGTGGNYRVDGGSISFGEIVTTMMSCGRDADAVERSVLEVLDGTVRYEIDGAVLTLSHPSGRALQFRAS